MDRIIVISGEGKLPKLVINKLKTKKNHYFELSLIKETSCSKNNIKYVKYGNIVSELIKLKKKGFNKILMAGSLKRPKINEIKPDINSIKLLPKFIKKILEGGDNNLLKFVIKELENLGFVIISLKKVVPDIFLGKGNQTKVKITKINFEDIKKGIKILKSNSKFDIGQSIIIQQGSVIAIEAAQGTDNLIKQSYPFIKSVKQAVLVKMVKSNQDIRVDLPTLGMKTVKNIKKYSLCGIAYSSDLTVILEKKKVIDYCERNKIFLFGV